MSVLFLSCPCCSPEFVSNCWFPFASNIPLVFLYFSSYNQHHTIVQETQDSKNWLIKGLAASWKGFALCFPKYKIYSKWKLCIPIWTVGCNIFLFYFAHQLYCESRFSKNIFSHHKITMKNPIKGRFEFNQALPQYIAYVCVTVYYNLGNNCFQIVYWKWKKALLVSL